LRGRSVAQHIGERGELADQIGQLCFRQMARLLDRREGFDQRVSILDAQ